MAEFYAYRIIAGYTTYAKVPQKYKPAVAEVLRQMDMEELIIE